ncbi:hypothetical protein Leryth_026314 [Lithospermum erythrorhizon]|nr:hypothetical protein Leryth_026314 [Lithospermum erythrorhizon]
MEENFASKDNSRVQSRGSETTHSKGAFDKRRSSSHYGVINTIAGGIAGGGDSSSQRKKYAKKEIRGDRDEDMERKWNPAMTQQWIPGVVFDIITTHTFNILKRESTKLEPIKTPLIGFGGNEVEAIGKVRLEVMLGEFPKCAIHEVDFLVVDLPYFAYNAIFGRPSLQKFKAVVAHVCTGVKFRFQVGMRSEQRTSKECYFNSMKRSRQKSPGRRSGRRPLSLRLGTHIKVERGRS